MATGPIHPLTDDHLSKIDESLANIERAKAQIRLATAAGIDVSTQQQQLEDMEKQLRSIRSVYFPGR